MKERLAKLLEHLINDAIYAVEKISYDNSRGSLSYVKRGWLNELLEALYLISKNSLLKPEDDIIVQRAFRVGEEIVYLKLTFFASYYYSKSTLIRKAIPQRD